MGFPCCIPYFVFFMFVLKQLLLRFVVNNSHYIFKRYIIRWYLYVFIVINICWKKDSMLHNVERCTFINNIHVVINRKRKWRFKCSLLSCFVYILWTFEFEHCSLSPNLILKYILLLSQSEHHNIMYKSK